MTMRKAMTIAVLLAVTTSLGACSRNRAPAELPPAPGGTENGGLNGGGDGAVVPGSQADFVASITADTIYFGTDQFNIDAADRAILDSQAAWLRRYPNVRVTVEGHADERGTRDYNLALGQRRADAARNYLVSLGIESSRINAITLGKERPVALGSDEASWAQNRRAVTITVQ
jgi:peptidoglycan-associated lipoprotein